MECPIIQGQNPLYMYMYIKWRRPSKGIFLRLRSLTENVSYVVQKF